MIVNQIADRALVRLHLTTDFVALDIDEFDLAVRASNSDRFTSLVEFAYMGDGISGVEIGNFLNLTNVPDFDDTIRVARADILPANRETAIIYGVKMTIEGLNGKPGAHVPN